MDNTYLELKEELKNKYSNKLLEEIKSISKNYLNNMGLILGENYLKIRVEFDTLDNYITTTKAEYFGQEKYIQCRNTVLEMNEKLNHPDDLSDTEQTKLESDLKTKLMELSDMNIIINNRLKFARDRQNEIITESKELLDLHIDDIKAMRDLAYSNAQVIISKYIGDFNKELKELNDVYGLTLSKPELPFDFSLDKLSINNKFESDYFANLDNNIKYVDNSISNTDRINTNVMVDLNNVKIKN